MARNFNIYSFKTRQSLHLKLSGDFDGSSAHELINTLTERGKDIFEIFIDTNELKSVHRFGVEVFQKNLCLCELSIKNLVFIGSNGNKIDAEEHWED
jgi:anti-anti-sigma regulatory factor